MSRLPIRGQRKGERARGRLPAARRWQDSCCMPLSSVSPIIRGGRHFHFPPTTPHISLSSLSLTSISISSRHLFSLHLQQFHCTLPTLHAHLQPRPVLRCCLVPLDPHLQLHTLQRQEESISKAASVNTWELGRIILLYYPTVHSFLPDIPHTYRRAHYKQSSGFF